MQSNFRLPVTGHLDPGTKQTMNKGRCGNADTKIQHPNGINTAQRDADLDMNGSLRRLSKHSNAIFNPDQRPRRVIRHADPSNHRHVRHHRHSRRHNHHHRRQPDLQSDLPIINSAHDEQKSDDEENVDVNAPIFNSAPLALDLMPFESVPNEAEEARLRRDALFEEIKSRIADTYMTNNQISIQDEQHLTVNNKTEKSEKRRNRHEASRLRRHGRQRRSLRAVSVDQVSEGDDSSSSRLDTRFKRDRLVRWRLLDDGIGSKIPLVEQKALLELSFRMWSEVTPIKFVEDRQTNVNNIDILVAFGKRQ